MSNNELIINNNGTPIANFKKNGDLLIKGNIIFGDSTSNAWVISPNNDTLSIQKSGNKGININTNGNITTSPILQSIVFPKI